MMYQSMLAVTESSVCDATSYNISKDVFSQEHPTTLKDKRESNRTPFYLWRLLELVWEEPKLVNVEQ